MSRSDLHSRWASLVMEHASSGKSAAAWCKARDVNVASFYDWRRKLSVSSSSVTFLEVTDAVPSSLEVTVGRVGIRIERGFDRGLFCDVLDVLEARRC